MDLLVELGALDVSVPWKVGVPSIGSEIGVVKGRADT